MSIDTQKLRQCAIESNDGLLRGPALAAADHIETQAAEIERLKVRADAADVALREAAEVINDRNAEIARLRGALEAMLEIHGVTQSYAEKHIEIPQSWVEVSDIARAALSGEGKC